MIYDQSAYEETDQYQLQKDSEQDVIAGELNTAILTDGNWAKNEQVLTDKSQKVELTDHDFRSQKTERLILTRQSTKSIHILHELSQMGDLRYNVHKNTMTEFKKQRALPEPWSLPTDYVN